MLLISFQHFHCHRICIISNSVERVVRVVDTEAYVMNTSDFQGHGQQQQLQPCGHCSSQGQQLTTQYTHI